MRALLVLLLVPCSACAIVASHANDPKPRIRGPIPTRTQEPVKLTFLAFRPRTANVAAEGARSLRVTSEYSSMFENGTGASDHVVLDGEIWRNAFAMTFGVAPKTDVEVEVPLVYATSGFLDRFVESWHSFFGLPGGGRDERERFTYEMQLEHDGDRVYHLEPNELGFGDVPVVVTHQLVDESDSAPAVSVRAGVDLPLGSESRGFGNGALDWGGGVLAEKSFGRWTATAAVDYVFTRRASSFVGSGVDVRDDLDLELGLEYRWNDSTSLLAGLVLNTAVTRDMTIMEIDRDMASANVGMAFDLPGGSIGMFGFEDDVIAESGPDFTVFASWSMGL